jgi:5'-3' exonuclease
VVPVETFDNAKLCKAWLQVQGKEKAEHYIRVPRKEIDEVSHALHTVKRVMGSIQAQFADGDMVSYFSCATADNWRTECYPEYKANRKDARKPFWYDDIRAYMDITYKCVQGKCYEADDLIAMRAYANSGEGVDWVIVSIDKDFLQIMGTHYNWVKEELVTIDGPTALQNLAVQRIAGDGVDNIKGCPGIGDAKARAHLFNSKQPDLEAMILEMYTESYTDLAEARWQEALTTAMVTLPEDHDHVNEMMEEVFNAKQTYEASSPNSGEADGGGGSSADKPAAEA